MAETNLSQSARLLLERIATENGIRNPRFELGSGSEQGDNYVGIMLRISVLGSGNNSDKKINLILKMSPKNENRRALYLTGMLFKQEIFVYDAILPGLTRLLKSKGSVPQNQVAFPSTARAYATHLSEDGSEDIVILEDMGKLGYVMGDRFAGADVEQCRVVIRALARLHAASIVLQYEDPEEHTQYVNNLQEMFAVTQWQESFVNIAKKAIPMIAARFPEGTEGRTKFENFVENYLPIVLQLAQPNSELSVFCHGDSWLNNILFKYEQGSTTPTEVCLIDMQIMRYASPVCDLAYFLFCSTTKPVRDQHFKQLLQDYYTFLCDFLKAFGCPSDKIVTWEVMEDQYRKYMKFGLGMALLALPVIMAKKGHTAGIEDELSETATLEETLAPTDGNNVERDERLSDVLQDMLELGYF